MAKRNSLVFVIRTKIEISATQLKWQQHQQQQRTLQCYRMSGWRWWTIKETEKLYCTNNDKQYWPIELERAAAAIIIAITNYWWEHHKNVYICVCVCLNCSAVPSLTRLLFVGGDLLFLFAVSVFEYALLALFSELLFLQIYLSFLFQSRCCCCYCYYFYFFLFFFQISLHFSPSFRSHHISTHKHSQIDS